jgi:hypothetical protein
MHDIKRNRAMVSLVVGKSPTVCKVLDVLIAAPLLIAEAALTIFDAIYFPRYPKNWRQ